MTPRALSMRLRTNPYRDDAGPAAFLRVVDDRIGGRLAVGTRMICSSSERDVRRQAMRPALADASDRRRFPCRR